MVKKLLKKETFPKSIKSGADFAKEKIFFPFVAEHKN